MTHDDLDMSWLDGIASTPPDARVKALRDLLAEFLEVGPEVIFLRSVIINDARYLAVATWTGRRNGKLCRVNGAPGKAKSLLAALGTLVEMDLYEEGPGGESRVWLLPHQAGMPLKVWCSIDGKNAAVRYFALTTDGHRPVDATEYTKLRGA